MAAPAPLRPRGGRPIPGVPRRTRRRAGHSVASTHRPSRTRRKSCRRPPTQQIPMPTKVRSIWIALPALIAAAAVAVALALSGGDSTQQGTVTATRSQRRRRRGQRCVRDRRGVAGELDGRRRESALPRRSRTRRPGRTTRSSTATPRTPAATRTAPQSSCAPSSPDVGPRPSGSTARAPLRRGASAFGGYHSVADAQSPARRPSRPAPALRAHGERGGPRPPVRRLPGRRDADGQEARPVDHAAARARRSTARPTSPPTSSAATSSCRSSPRRSGCWASRPRVTTKLEQVQPVRGPVSLVNGTS